MDLVHVFNTKLSELIADVCRVSPSCMDLKLAANMALIADPMAALRVFIDHGDSYDEHVLRRDDSVFLSDEFRVPAIPDSFDIVQRLRQVWGSFTEAERDIVWKYLNVLVILKQRFKRQKER